MLFKYAWTLKNCCKTGEVAVLRVFFISNSGFLLWSVTCMCVSVCVREVRIQTSRFPYLWTRFPPRFGRLTSFRPLWIAKYYAMFLSFPVSYASLHPSLPLTCCKWEASIPLALLDPFFTILFTWQQEAVDTWLIIKHVSKDSVDLFCVKYIVLVLVDVIKFPLNSKKK